MIAGGLVVWVAIAAGDEVALRREGPAPGPQVSEQDLRRWRERRAELGAWIGVSAGVAGVGAGFLIAGVLLATVLDSSGPCNDTDSCGFDRRPLRWMITGGALLTVAAVPLAVLGVKYHRHNKQGPRPQLGLRGPGLLVRF